MSELPEDWIAHDGGPCPVPLHSMPDVLFADGFAHRKRFQAHVYGPLWHRRGLGRSIVAYRPESPTEALTAAVHAQFERAQAAAAKRSYTRNPRILKAGIR